MRSLTLAAILMLGAAPAWADGPMSTSNGAQTAAPEPTTAPPALPAEKAGAAEQAVAMGPCGLEKVKPDGKLETAPHGEAYAGIGTHGYRELGGTVCQPIGQNGAVTLSIDETKGDYRR